MYAAYFVTTSCLIWKDRASSGPRHDFVTHQLQKKHPCRLAGYCGAIRSSDDHHGKNISNCFKLYQACFVSMLETRTLVLAVNGKMVVIIITQECDPERP